MVNHFGNSVIQQCCKKSGWSNNVLKYSSFLKQIIASRGYLERLTNFNKSKLKMVYNT